MCTLNYKKRLSKITQLETLNQRNNQVKQQRELQVRPQTKLQKKHQANHLLSQSNLVSNL